MCPFYGMVMQCLGYLFIFLALYDLSCLWFYVVFVYIVCFPNLCILHGQLNNVSKEKVEIASNWPK